MDLVVNDKYEIQVPSPENLVALFEDQWVSALPGFPSGDVGLFEDDRIRWAIDLAGGVAGKRVLELGPLEGAHSYMLHRGGAAQVTAIEANTLCYVKCLLVQQLFDLDRVEFQLGNFVPWLETTDDAYDLVVAAGVLYHLADPVPVLDRLCQVSSEVYLWTHFVDFEAMPKTDRRYKRWFVGRRGARVRRSALPAAPPRVQEEPDQRPEVHRRRAHQHGLDREADHPRRVRGARLRRPGRPRDAGPPQRPVRVVLRAEEGLRCRRRPRSRSRRAAARSGCRARTG